MAAEIEIKKINQYVQELVAVTSITGAYVYGVDSNGNSIKIAVETLAAACEDYSAEIAELQEACQNNATLIAQLQSALRGKANAVHTHQQSDITGLTAALEGKAAASHTHAQSDITGLTTALNGKANAVHSHQQSDISGLSDTLAGKAAAVHTHNQADIVGLEAALGNKADTDHTHAITDVEGLQNSLANINARINEIDGGGVGNALRQEDLNTYTDAKSGDVIQNLGETSEVLQKYFVYECTEGSTVKTITSGTRCLRLVQGASEFISDQEVDANTDKFILYYRPTVDGVTYNFFGFATLGETERAKLVGTYVVTDGGETFQITDVTASGNNITAIALDNGVTLPISGQTPTRSTQALLTFYASNGVEYYGTVGDCTLCSKDIVSNVAGTQSYLIATAPIGTLFGAQTDIFTASEDIVFKSVTWTQRNVQPPTSVASGDNFLSQTDGAISSTISIGYNSTNQHLELKGINDAVVAYVDMAVFIKDGMLENVEKYTTPEQGVTVAVPYLKFTFNTDSGKSVIRISFADLIDTFDGSNVDLTSAFVKAAQYSAPAIGDSMDVAIGKLLKGHEDNATAIAGKQATLTFDDTPTTGSDNPVKSGGIKTALDAVANGGLKLVDLTTYQGGTNDEIVRHNGRTTEKYVNGYDYKFSTYTAGTTASSNYYQYKSFYELPSAEAAALIADCDFYIWDCHSEFVAGYQRCITTMRYPQVGDNVIAKEMGVFAINAVVDDDTIKFANNSNTTFISKATPTAAYRNDDGLVGFLIKDDLNNDCLYVPDATEAHKRFIEVTISQGGKTFTDWVQWNSQPSSASDVSALQQRMTAAETAISGKQDSLTFDNAPTANSGNVVKSGGVKSAIDFAPRFYLGTCSTAGNVAIKQVDITNFPTQLVNGVETPIVGSVIAVKFSNSDNNHINDESGKIKVNNTSAYPVWYNTEENQSVVSDTCFGVANRYGYYIFNGTHWVWVNHGIDNDTTYTPPSLGFGYASCATAAATAAKTATLNNYKLVNNGLVVVYFQYDVPAQATLNISSKGAKQIHFQGSRIAAGVIKGGDKCLFIYNGNYMLIAIDRWGKELQEKVSGINISETDFEALSTYEQGKLYFVYDNNS